METGSSGGPLFDANHFIIGQLWDGDNNIGCQANGGGLVDNNTFGKTNVSWLGGGTSETGLAPWLGITIPMDVNFSIVGPEILCHSEEYCLNSPSNTVNWTIQPSSVFDLSYLEPTDRKSCAIVELTSSYNGYATITYDGEIQYGGLCSIPIERSRSFWVGKPPLPVVRSRCIENELSLWIDPDFKIPLGTTFKWETWNEVFGYEIWEGISAIDLDFFFGNYEYKLTFSNECGDSSVEGKVKKEKECGIKDELFKIQPNPGVSMISVLFDKNNFGNEKTIKIIDSQANIVLVKTVTMNHLQIDVLGLQQGVYLIVVSDKHKVSVQKFIKQ